MKLSLPPRLALAVALGACSFAVAAQTVDVDATAQAEAVVAETDGDAVVQVDVEREVDRRCLRSTGSRIVAARNDDTPRKDEATEVDANAEPDCVIGSGRVYTKEDLDGTGHTTIEEALRALDPRVH